ncbi:MFS transporter [Neopusillimonas aromaticivorans]|uniref:MFS transporter n=1 Tax=Neopusillimonas aromaticivorans TaxID=2979868 RepID=UPI003314CFD1
MTSGTGAARLAGLRYGALGLPLAFVALPLYVYMPAYYAEQFGASLAALGTVLLLVRIFDAVTDPLMGYAADHLLAMSRSRRLPAMGLGCVVLLLGFLGLFFLRSRYGREAPCWAGAPPCWWWPIWPTVP